DMMLPGRSGFLVLEKIKARKPRNAKPHVIMITGNQGARHKMYAESLGVSEYFNKPVKLDKLVASAEKLLTAPAACRTRNATGGCDTSVALSNMTACACSFLPTPLPAVGLAKMSTRTTTCYSV